jgi:beta-aspartyl-peptidase (threonine type)
MTEISPVLALHTGAKDEKLDMEKEKGFKNGMFEALKLGWEMLNNGKTCVDVVEAVCCVLEDNGLFNAGVGSDKNTEGKFELEAAIMEGKKLQTGAVANVKTIKNPIKCARLLMQEKHFFISGDYADYYAAKKNLKTVDNEYFKKISKTQKEEPNKRKLGTVGVVCLDKYGNLAAATSTGGVESQPPGRVGDSAIIGTGLYANNHTCAISCTGEGEPMMKMCMAFTVHATIKYLNWDLKKSCQHTLDELEKIDGPAGIIAIDKNGNLEMKYNTPIMGRGYIKDGKCEIFVNEPSEDLTPTNYII